MLPTRKVRANGRRIVDAAFHPQSNARKEDLTKLSEYLRSKKFSIEFRSNVILYTNGTVTNPPGSSAMVVQLKTNRR